MGRGVDGSVEPKLALLVAVAGLALALGLQFGRILVLGAAHKCLPCRDFGEIDLTVGQCEDTKRPAFRAIPRVQALSPGVGAANRGRRGGVNVIDECTVVAKRARFDSFGHVSHTPRCADA
jgi:hypothetical protein